VSSRAETARRSSAPSSTADGAYSIFSGAQLDLFTSATAARRVRHSRTDGYGRLRQSYAHTRWRALSTCKVLILLASPRGFEPLLTAVQDRFRRLDVITSRLHNEVMDSPKRATVYFSADVHKALRLRAAAADRSISDMVNDAVRIALAEDATDLESFKELQDEKSISFETFVTGLKRRGRI